MASFKICFGTECVLFPEYESGPYEQQYQNLYKPLVSLLYTLPELLFSLYIPGPTMEWLEHHHTEFFMILEEMISRKQLDILGGGYYSPLFPLIPPTDRVGQIELLTTILRKHLGKRPRGAWLASSAWEPSLVSSMNTCGIEYILLDKAMIATSGFPSVDGRLPVTLEDSGKTILAFPLENGYRNLDHFTPTDFYNEISSSENGEEQILVVFFDPHSVPALCTYADNDFSWFESLLQIIRTEGNKIELTTPSGYLKSKKVFKRAYISSGMTPYDFDESYSKEDIRILARTSSKYFLLHSPNIMNLYAKMMYVHILVNQLRGDKSRKKSAREELWRAQNCDYYRSNTSKSLSVHKALRTVAYKNLLVAEKMARIRGVFSPSINTFDFDMDGLKEYLCQMDTINMYVHSCGGRIFELDILNLHKNYTDISLPSVGMFIDNLVTTEEIVAMQDEGKVGYHTLFSDTTYQEISLNPSKYEIQLKTDGLYGTLQQPISLRKQYSFRNEGVQVQYILKNESPFNLVGNFMIELDFALTQNRNHAPVVSIYAHDTRQDSIIQTTQLTDVSWLRIDDSVSGARFTIESNENPSLFMIPIFSPEDESLSESDILEGVRVFLFWKVDIGPSFETEKMVFLKIDA